MVWQPRTPKLMLVGKRWILVSCWRCPRETAYTSPNICRCQNRKPMKEIWKKYPGSWDHKCTENASSTSISLAHRQCWKLSVNYFDLHTPTSLLLYYTLQTTLFYIITIPKLFFSCDAHIQYRYNRWDHRGNEAKVMVQSAHHIWIPSDLKQLKTNHWISDARQMLVFETCTYSILHGIGETRPYFAFKSCKYWVVRTTSFNTILLDLLLHLQGSIQAIWDSNLLLLNVTQILMQRSPFDSRNSTVAVESESPAYEKAYPILTRVPMANGIIRKVEELAFSKDLFSILLQRSCNAKGCQGLIKERIGPQLGGQSHRPTTSYFLNWWIQLDNYLESLDLLADCRDLWFAWLKL